MLARESRLDEVVFDALDPSAQGQLRGFAQPGIVLKVNRAAVLRGHGAEERVRDRRGTCRNAPVVIPVAPVDADHEARAQVPGREVPAQPRRESQGVQPRFIKEDWLAKFPVAIWAR